MLAADTSNRGFCSGLHTYALSCGEQDWLCRFGRAFTTYDGEFREFRRRCESALVDLWCNGKPATTILAWPFNHQQDGTPRNLKRCTVGKKCSLKCTSKYFWINYFQYLYLWIYIAIAVRIRIPVKALACKELFAQSEGKLNLSRALHCAMVERGGHQQNIWMVVVSSLSIGYMQCIIYTV